MPRLAVSAALVMLAATSAEAATLYHTPADFSATYAVNDDVDDRAAVQACMDASKASGLDCILPPGITDIESRSFNTSLGNPRRIMSLEAWRNDTRIKIRGVGPATVLRMRGSGYNGDWWMIGCFESPGGIDIRDMTLSGGTITPGTGTEQRHLFNAAAGCARPVVERVVMTLPELGNAQGGDCLRYSGNGRAPSGPPNARGSQAAVQNTGTGLSFVVTRVFSEEPRPGVKGFVTTVAPGPTWYGTITVVGNTNYFITDTYFGQDPAAPSLVAADYVVGYMPDAHLVTDVLARDVLMVNCDRSGVGYQRGILNGLFESFVIIGTGDQDGDMEATGVVYPEDRIRRVTLRDWFVIRTRGGLSLSIGRGDHLRVENVHILNGNVFFLSCVQCALEDSYIVGDSNPANGDSTVAIRRAVDGMTIKGSTIMRPTTAFAAPVVSVTADTNGSPRDVKIIDSNILQGTRSVGVHTQNSEVDVHGSTLVYQGPVNAPPPPPAVSDSPNGGPNAVAIVLNAVIGRAWGAAIGNKFRGAWWGAVQVTAPADTAPPDAVLGPYRFVANEVDGPARSLQCLGNNNRFRDVVRAANTGGTGRPRSDGSAPPNQCLIATVGL